jgi:hypothetical protein
VAGKLTDELPDAEAATIAHTPTRAVQAIAKMLEKDPSDANRRQGQVISARG